MSVQNGLQQQLAMIRGKKMIIEDIINSTLVHRDNIMYPDVKNNLGEYKGKLGTYEVLCAIPDIRVGYRVMRDFVEKQVFSAVVHMNLTVVISCDEGPVGELSLSRQAIPINMLPVTIESRIREHMTTNAPKFNVADINTSASFRMRQEEYAQVNANDFFRTYQYCMAYTHTNENKIISQREFDEDSMRMYRDQQAAGNDIAQLLKAEENDDWIFNHTLNGLKEVDLINAIICMNYLSSMTGIETIDPNVEQFFMCHGGYRE